MKVQRGKEIVDTFGPFHVKDEYGNWWRVYGDDGDVSVAGPATDLVVSATASFGAVFLVVGLILLAIGWRP